MKYLLDTNICVHFFRGKFKLLEKFNAVNLDNCAISEITPAELTYGAENSSNPEKNVKLIDDFMQYVKVIPIFNGINIYAKEKVKLRRKGEIISDFDLLIAATAIANDLIMFTVNIKRLSTHQKTTN